jgi:hypothetical protein
MFVKRANTSSDARARSLLQKAVRRGDTKVVERAARYLHNVGDKTWLRSRVAVITFEECWPLAEELTFTVHLDSRIASLQRVASTQKQKDAAGLGTLAYALTEGHKEVLDLAPEQEAVRAVSRALGHPHDFLDWAERNTQESDAIRVLSAARKYLPSATWPWDKACLLAAAYLAMVAPIPKCLAVASHDLKFPYWVALDKHTPQGKDVIRRMARERLIPYRQILWASFYFESARANALMRSPWWNAERTWRLRQAGLSVEAALDLWRSLRSDFEQRLARAAEQLRLDIEASSPLQPKLL